MICEAVSAEVKTTTKEEARDKFFEAWGRVSRAMVESEVNYRLDRFNAVQEIVHRQWLKHTPKNTL